MAGYTVYLAFYGTQLPGWAVALSAAASGVIVASSLRGLRRTRQQSRRHVLRGFNQRLQLKLAPDVSSLHERIQGLGSGRVGAEPSDSE